jgi:hypothetical protein
MAPPATIVQETTAVMAAVAMTMVMSVWFLRLNAASSQVPTGGRLASTYRADRLALGAIDSVLMTPFFMNEFSFQSVVCQKIDSPGADGNASVLSPTVSI